MKDPGDLGEFLHDPHAVLVGLPLMNDHGQLQLPGQGHLGAESALLDFPGDVLIVVVQSDLADGPHLGALPC